MIPFTTEPHAQHQITLIEDAVKPQNRIYAIKDLYNNTTVMFLGGEMQSIVEWWQNEQHRTQNPPSQ